MSTTWQIPQVVRRWKGARLLRVFSKSLVANGEQPELLSSPALSRDNEGDNDRGQIYHGAHDKAPEIENYHGRHEVSAPEIDPGQLVGALALLSGTMAIIRGYRRKK